MAKLVLSVMGASAEFEQALIRERQRDGIALAKQRDAYRGRKKSLSPDQVIEIRRRVGEGEVKARLSVNTDYRCHRPIWTSPRI